MIGPLLTFLGADLLDSIPSVNLYLLRVPLVPVLSFTLSLLGVAYIETDTTMDNPTFRNLGLLTSVAPPDFYRLQPALTLIRADKAVDYYAGYGVIVADINSATDSSHPRCRATSLEVSTSYRPRDQRMLSSISPHRISSIRPLRAFSISRAPLIRQPPPF